MTSTLKHLDYFGSAEVDVERGVLRGKLLFIADLVTYEAKTPAALQAEFEAAVQDYVETCKMLGKDPQKSFTGQFNVRTSPECHKQLAIAAAQDGCSLNSIVDRALMEFVNRRHSATGSNDIQHASSSRYGEGKILNISSRMRGEINKKILLETSGVKTYQGSIDFPHSFAHLDDHRADVLRIQDAIGTDYAQ